MIYPIQHYQKVLAEYQQLAIRTAPNLPATEQHEHCMDGIFTELGELLDVYKRHRYYGKDIDMVNVIEEGGDVLWYFAVLHETHRIIMLTNVTEKDTKTQTWRRGPSTTNYKIRDFFMFCLDDFGTDGNNVNYVLCCLIDLLEHCGVVIADACEKNIAKLKARYPVKFDEAKAINRDLDAERKTLE